MSVSAPPFARPGSAPDAPRISASRLSMQWTAVQDAAAAVAALAGIAPEKPTPEIRNFPALIKDAGGRRLELAERGVADLSAILQPGLTALLAVNARGQDAAAAALTLWREFHAARDAILRLAPPPGSMGPRRSA